ncbi:hypothetical protein FRC08_015213 [Ceratobasidium sp. 394]|nr:hypothetical protein FRC08_015213 [Ceratobasidium sp. 394]
MSGLLVFSSLLVLVASLQLNSKIIDDSYDYDPTRPDGIQYSPDWVSNPSLSGSSPRYNNTFHWTTTPQASFIYFFQGNAIYYYADKDVSNAPVSVALDSGDEEFVHATAPSTQTQQLLWSRTGLGPGDHQVVVKHNGTASQYLGLDYLRIESDHGFAPNISGPAASSVPPEALLVDDTDSSLIYSSNWTTNPAGQYGGYFGRSLHVSETPGDSVTFKFKGTAVWYFSNTNRRHGNVQIRVDGGAAEPVSAYGFTWLQQQLQWSKTDLSDGEHTLVRSNDSNSNSDFLPPGSVKLGISLGPFHSSSPKAPLTHPPSQSSSSTNGKSHLGAIIGGTIGGVALLALCALTFFYLRHRRSLKLGSVNSIDLLGRGERETPMLPEHAPVPYGSYPQPTWDHTGHTYHVHHPHHIPGGREKRRANQGRAVVRAPTGSDSSLLSSSASSSSGRSVVVGSERSRMLPPPYPS